MGIKAITSAIFGIFATNQNEMGEMDMAGKLEMLAKELKGGLCTDNTHKIIYATDASAYRQMPIAIAYPKDYDDLRMLIAFAKSNSIPLIPRTAGTSLAGQTVGSGIIVDLSKHFTQILEINAEEQWVRVQPGVILDELNISLKEYGLFFGPETSTASRCMIGGMISNNSCGSHSIVYGSTRDHLLEVNMLLSDGSEAHFAQISKDEFAQKLQQDNLEGNIYRKINELLTDNGNQTEIKEQYPDPALRRRNNGYALDLLLDNEVFGDSDKHFNLCSLIAGSEGTLGLITEAKLHLSPLPPKEKAVICIHLHTLEEAFLANLVALKYEPTAVELMDKNILDLTKDNLEQSRNRFFVNGEPAAILIVEIAENKKEIVEAKYKALVDAMKHQGFGYDYPIVWGSDISKVWALRKAGLGVLSNMKGDAKPVSVTEDTAVVPDRLPMYMKEFREVMSKYGLDCVFHAHIGSGELHLRPILNLKNEKDRELFRLVATDVARLVKKYRGSLSGEHGDGRLRGEFIPLMVGEKCFEMMKEVKRAFDPQCIFNPNKIIDTPQMNSSLRYTPCDKDFGTLFRYDEAGGYLRAIEKCNGSGDCRKTILTGGTMCPSYMATKDEDKTTRARANMLREILTNSEKPFENKDLYNILDLCLSCKGCKSECPSSVDMAKLKAEYLQHYYDKNGIPFRSRLVAYVPRLYKLGSILPSVTNFFMSNSFTRLIGFSDKRQMPLMHSFTLKSWFKKRQHKGSGRIVYFFNDEFTNYNDVETGIKAILLLQALGYDVVIPRHEESGRTFLSKGLVRTAKRIANQNIEILGDIVSETTPMVGIEPSAILSFRDEYPDLATDKNLAKAKALAKNSMMIEEFLMQEIEKGNIKESQFTEEPKEIYYHGHCQQKSIATTKATKFILGFPKNYSVTEMKTGCCGMAGSFGYEKEHYDLSIQIGELALFPAVRAASMHATICASGTSCRHQIKDGTGRDAVHPIEVLYDALVKK